jgi:hypothetical protein
LTPLAASMGLAFTAMYVAVPIRISSQCEICLHYTKRA